MDPYLWAVFVYSWKSFDEGKKRYRKRIADYRRTGRKFNQTISYFRCVMIIYDVNKRAADAHFLRGNWSRQGAIAVGNSVIHIHLIRWKFQIIKAS